ncbi:MAG: glycosyltransferase [Candidatus Humimicrobiaceae bacterium]
MAKLKILIVNDYGYIQGGAAKVAIESAILLAEKGHDVTYFCAVGPVCKELTESKVKQIICLSQSDLIGSKNKLSAALTNIFNIRAVRKIKNLIKASKPNICHMHGISKALSFSIITPFYNYKIPVVYTLHDYSLACPNSGIYNFKKNEICRLYESMFYCKCLITDCDKRSYSQKLWRWLRFFISFKILNLDKKISGFIAVSNYVLNIFKPMIRKGAKIKMIRNPIFNDFNPDINLSDCKNPKYEKTTFMYIGRLSEEKGIDLILEAIEKVDANLYIFGEGEKSEYIRNRSLADKTDKIKLFGWQDNQVVESELKKCSALILASKTAETGGIVVLEAAKFCVPSIVPDIGGPSEFVTDDFNGYCFKSGNTDSLINKMNNFVDDPDLSLELGMNAKKSLPEFNIGTKKYINDLEDFYMELITNKNNFYKL